MVVNVERTTSKLKNCILLKNVEQSFLRLGAKLRMVGVQVRLQV